MSKPPTPKQRKAAQAIVKNLLSDAPQPESKVLANIGYSKGITETPSIVTESVGFKQAIAESGLKQALIAQGIDAKKIAQKIDVLLNAKEQVFKNNNTTGKIELVGEKDDYTAIDKGLKHATAIHGVIHEVPKENTIYNFILNPTFQQQIKPLEELLKQQFKNVQPNQTMEKTVDVNQEKQELS